MKRILQDHSGIVSALKSDVQADNAQMENLEADHARQVAENGLEIQDFNLNLTKLK